MKVSIYILINLKSHRKLYQSFNMSTSVYVYKETIFEAKEEPLKYLLPTLLLQNFEYCKINDNDPSFFPSYIMEMMFDDPDIIDLVETKKNKNLQEEKFKDLNKFFTKMVTTQTAKELYEYLNKNISDKFCILMQAAIQRILLKLFTLLSEDENNPITENSNFTESFEMVKRNKILDDPIIVMIFLKLLRKNCKVYCDPSSKIPSLSYEIDETYPFLFLYLDSKKSFKFMFMEKPGVESESYYDKITIKEDRKCLISQNQNLKQENKQEEDNNDDGDEKDEEKEEEDEKEEDAEEDEKEEKTRRTGKKLNAEEAFKEFIDYMFKRMLNWPEAGFDEGFFKKKISERLYTYLNEKDKQVDDFEKWKSKCLKFKTWFDTTKFKEKKDIKDYQKEWKKRINS